MKIKLITVAIIIALIFTSCKKYEQIDDAYAGILVEYVNYYNKEFDKKIVQTQKDLKLNTNQVEILYLMKSDLLATVPDLRKMIFKVQMQFADILQKEKLSIDDILVLEKDLDIYNNILRDTAGKRIIELHATLNKKQKEKLAYYIDKGKVMHFPVKTIPLYRLYKPVMKLYGDLKLSLKQQFTAIKYSDSARKELKKGWNTMRKAAKDQREEFKMLVLSDKIELSQLDTIANRNLKLLDPFKIESAKKIISFNKTLSKNQKEVLIKFISEFNYL